MPASEQRDQEIAELRQMHARNFELKLKNRRMEVRQLEKQLNDRQDRQAKRKDLKACIIDQRLRNFIL